MRIIEYYNPVFVGGTKISKATQLNVKVMWFKKKIGECNKLIDK